MKSNVTHTITLVISSAHNPTNHLNLHHRLQCIIATHCSCEQGSRTNGACSHIQAFVIAVFCPEMFRTAKKMQSRLSDIRRPVEHNPQASGPPAESRDISVLGQIVSCNPRRSLNSRRNQRARYTQQDQQVPLQQPNRTPVTTVPVRARNQCQNPLPGQIGHLRNIQNTCYAISTLQILFKIKLRNHLVQLPPIVASVQNLQREFISASVRRENHLSPPFTVVSVVTALNACLLNPTQFTLGQPQCASDFLVDILTKLNIDAALFTLFKDSGVCTHCNRNSTSPDDITVLGLGVPDRQQEINISVLIARRLTTFNRGILRCQNVGPCNNTPIVSCPILQRRGDVMLLSVDRSVFRNGVIDVIGTPLQEPIDNDARWPGMRCTGAVVHETYRQTPSGPSIGGHWIVYLRYGNDWSELDSSQHNQIPRNNPFREQTRNKTINILLFEKYP
jgi:hypothetical protein